MSAPMSEPVISPPAESEYLTVRLTPDLVEFVESQAAAMCNSKAGILKFALTKLRESVAQQAAQPEAQEANTAA